MVECRAGGELIAPGPRTVQPGALRGEAGAVLSDVRTVQQAIALLRRLVAQQRLPDASPFRKGSIGGRLAGGWKSAIPRRRQCRPLGSARLVHRLIQRIVIEIAIESVRAD